MASPIKSSVPGRFKITKGFWLALEAPRLESMYVTPVESFLISGILSLAQAPIACEDADNAGPTVAALIDEYAKRIREAEW